MKEEKLKKLNDSINTLKKEFIGLDSIIEELRDCITPWYVTPEVIKRPVVISMWGMTGTGKSSVVKRLLELLGLTGRSLFFDCGQESDNSNSNNISESICDYINGSDCSYDFDEITKDLIFIFDEFQHSRTINEMGLEIEKSQLRPIWNIIDDGILKINAYRYDITSVQVYLKDIYDICNSNKEIYEIKVNKGKVFNPRDKKLLLDSDIGSIYFDCNIHPIEVGKEDTEEVDSDPIIIFDKKLYRVFLKKLNSYKPGLGSKLVKKMKESDDICLGDWLTELKNYQSIILKQKTVDCSKSLVFIIGNLDEAFGIEKELNPDFDADTFYDMTSKVTISDIKASLKKRFRAEQIARFGNNLIKYPSLRKSSFIEIIKKELNYITSEFRNSYNIDINYGEDIINLIYSEGVYPVQGVRPVFTTINSMITPLLSDIILENSRTEVKSVLLTLENIDDWKVNNFKLSDTNLLLKFDSGSLVKKNIKLQLGSLRNPKNKKTRYINSVHESGHAILFAYCKGIAPINIVSVSTDNGGFCSTYDSENNKEIFSKQSIQEEVMIGLAGYEAERLIYDDENRCLMGSSSDIKESWDILSDSAYLSGYFAPYSFSNYSVESGYFIPNGISDSESISYKETRNIKIQKDLINEFFVLTEKTRKILSNEIELLKKLSLYLGEVGSIDSDKFLEFVEKYGNQLTIDYMKSKKESDNYYFDKLK